MRGEGYTNYLRFKTPNVINNNVTYCIFSFLGCGTLCGEGRAYNNKLKLKYLSTDTLGQ